ncbi:hypothetical protein [Kineosporia succinea]|uniref:Uncharacterized protein n=1 Tax=Kineosporia succinea TaxID=84632 RepID=A0ABT9P5P8_9ACTN|nr:hypothetical protein [Kineosporia succinea]MDP9828009.1 hypothetical protein [Kineosporia succinea]
MSTGGTDFFQNRTSYDSPRRGLESPRDRERLRTGSQPITAAPGPETGSQTVIRSQIMPARSITWGTMAKITLAIYFAVMMVLVTLALVAFILMRLAVSFASDQIEEFKINWQTTSAPVSSPGS